MQILAIDPGIQNTGWAVALNHSLGSGITMECGTITTHPKMSLESRIKTIGGVLSSRWPKWDVVLIEDTFGNFVKKTTLLIGGLLYALNAEAFVFISPYQWVKGLFGKEAKGQYKEKAMELAKERDWKPETQHAADAAAMIEWYWKHG